VPLKRELSPDEVKHALKARIGGSFEQHEVRLRHLEDVVERGSSPLHRFEHALAPWVAFFIMPVFALFNAGVGLAPVDDRPLLSIATVAVFLGLLVGKPLGIVGFVWLAERVGLIRRPAGTSWATLAGIGLVAGIGFTMALFIAHLAFGAGPALDQAKIGVLAASVVAAVAGLLVLHTALRPAVTTARP
jgi:NhaA family Na+:H+ antiporter